jgi:hypothetical protein
MVNRGDSAATLALDSILMEVAHLNMSVSVNHFLVYSFQTFI